MEQEINVVMDQLDAWVGSMVKIVEQLTRKPGTLDRHFTTSSSMVMQLEHVGIAFSGANIMLLGKAYDIDVGYQVTCDRLVERSATPEKVMFVERFGTAAERFSTVECLSNPST